MAWNAAALQLLGIQSSSGAGAGLVADTERWLRRQLPAAVGEWLRVGADRRLAQLSDNHIADLARSAHQNRRRPRRSTRRSEVDSGR